MKNENIILADIASHSIEGNSVGHYFAIARNYLRMIPNCKIAGGPIYKSHIPFRDLLMLPFDITELDNIIVTKYHELKNFIFLLKHSEGKKIIFQQSALATVLLFIAFFKKPNCKLFIISYDDDAIRGKIKKIIYKFAKHKIDGVICPNKRIGELYGLPYIVLPDYIYTGSSVDQCNDVSKKSIDFCLIGRLSLEKGALEIIQKYRGSNYKILIAGRPETDEIKRSLEDAADNYKNISLDLAYIDEEKYKKYISMSRYALLNYSGEYSLRSSGVVFDVIFAKVPVVGRRCKALEFIEENKCGILYNNLKEFEADKELTQQFYIDCLHNIDIYRETHKQYINSLRDFLLL